VLESKGGAVIGDEAVGALLRFAAGIAKMKVPRRLGWQVRVIPSEPHRIGHHYNHYTATWNDIDCLQNIPDCDDS
jgi:hypothetical protein